MVLPSSPKTDTISWAIRISLPLMRYFSRGSDTGVEAGSTGWYGFGFFPPPFGGSGSPSNAGSLNFAVALRKSSISKCHLPLSFLSRVPRPMICLNSVIEPISLSMTINPQVLQSTPVDRSSEVVTITG